MDKQLSFRLTFRESFSQSFESMPGHTHLLKKSHLLIFDDPNKAWYIEKGAVDIQGTRFSKGMPVGSRRSLFQLTYGRIIFGNKPLAEYSSQGWIGIVATEEAVVREIKLDDFDKIMIRDEKYCRAMIENWVNKIGLFTDYDIQPPSSILRIPERGDYDFGKDEIITAPVNDFLWLKVNSGAIILWGQEKFPILPKHGYIMLSGFHWAKVVSQEVSLKACFSARSLSSKQFRHALLQLHGFFSIFLHEKSLQEQEFEAERRKASKNQESLATDVALGELNSVLDPKEIFPLRETPLLTSLTALGKIIGIDIMPPSSSEDMKRINHPIEPIARASNIRARKITLGPEWWLTDSGPVLAYLGEEKKPVALIPCGSGYDIVDPDKRYRESLNRKKRQQIQPEAYMLYQPLPENLKGIKDFLKFTISGKVGDLIFIIALGILITVLGMILPKVTGDLVDTAIPSADRDYIYQLALVLTAVGIASALFLYVQVMTTVRFSMRTEVSAQAALWDRLLSFRPNFFRRYSSGELENRVNSITEISNELSAATIKPLISGVLALLNLLLLWYYSWELAKISLWIGLVVLLIVLLLGYLVRKLAKKLYAIEGAYNGLVIQMIRGISKIRVANSEQRAFNFWLEKYSQKLRLVMKINRLKDMVTIINQILPPVCLAILFWKAAKLTIDLPVDDESRISIADFIAFNTAFTLYITGWVDLSSAVVSVLDSSSKIDRVRILLEESPEVKKEASDPGRLQGHIKMEKISFRYTEDGPLILDNISCEAEPGKYIAFVGPSGSGKSTLLRLLLGFESPEYGRILYDGQELSGLNILSVRRQIGTVLQNGRLNSANIMENISNNARMTNAEIWDAVDDSGLMNDVTKMPMGLHTMVSEGGSNLSGGQRQRLLIARALAIRPKIVMFDEATSALDNKTQSIVSAALDRRNVTRIVIAHRLSTIQNADWIYVLDQGKLVQEGTFEELRDQDGLFQKLILRQMI